LPAAGKIGRFAAGRNGQTQSGKNGQSICNHFKADISADTLKMIHPEHYHFHHAILIGMISAVH
jgi:hypothetical protein